MIINNWKYKLFNIDKYPNEIFNQDESILANSVIAINYDLKKKINKNEKILEIGCGVDSWLRDNLNPGENKWYGIDVKQIFNGKMGIATDIGSVHDMPYNDNSFDIILANQSIEHWSEYGITIEEGLNEIGRCIKQNGEVHLNFPMFLHGEPIFVKGEIEKIIKIFEKNFIIEDIIAYYSKKAPDYKGWKLCGFPSWLVKNSNTSFVVNVILKKKININYLKIISKKNVQRKNILILHSRYGFFYFIWKVYNYLKRHLKRK